jgi:MFS family permease
VTAVFILSNTATPLYVLWQHALGFSKGMLTIIFACYIAGLIGSLLVSGVLSDRIGRKPVVLPALLLAMAACVLFATAGSALALAAARLLTGVAIGALVSAGMAAVTEVAGPARKRLAALLASTAMVFGAGLGPLLAGVLSETLPGPTVTVFVAEIAVLGSAALVVLRMPLRRHATATRTWIRVPRVPGGARLHLTLGIAVFAPGITATSFVLSLGPSLLSSLLGTSNRAVAGAMAFVMFLAATGAQFAVQRLKVHSILLTGAVSTVASMAALIAAVQARSAALLVVAAVLAGVGQGLGQLGGLSLLNASVPATRLAEANAALNIGGYIPAGVLPVAAGYLSDAVGLRTASTAFGIAIIAAAILGGLLVLTTRHRSPSAKA